MDKSNLNISKSETYLHSIIDNVVSDNTYVGTLPDTIQTKWNDMCLIEIPNGITDMGAYGVGTILVWLYARPLSSGRKNVSVMSKLEQKLDEVIASATSDKYCINRRSTYTDYDSERKWHCNIVVLNITIL